MRRIPVIPTLVVLAAVAVMIRLGVWQIERLHWKQALIAYYAAAQADTATHRWPSVAGLPIAYSRVETDCMKVIAVAPQAGQNAKGQAGWAQVADCVVPDGQRAQVVIGWSARPDSVAWAGGRVSGTWLDKGSIGNVIVADPPQAGLQPNARPNPAEVPNNHLAYAVQWFLFAATALVIYALALRKRLAAAARRG